MHRQKGTSAQQPKRHKPIYCFQPASKFAKMRNDNYPLYIVNYQLFYGRTPTAMKKKLLQFLCDNKSKVIKVIGTLAVGVLIFFLNSCASTQQIHIQQEVDGVKQETIIKSDMELKSIALRITPQDIVYCGNNQSRCH